MTSIVNALKGVKPNRIAVYIAALASLLTALAPIVADLDVTSVVGLVSGLAALVAVVDRFLKGWQAHEQQEAVVARDAAAEAAYRAAR